MFALTLSEKFWESGFGYALKFPSRYRTPSVAVINGSA